MATTKTSARKTAAKKTSSRRDADDTTVMHVRVGRTARARAERRAQEEGLTLPEMIRVLIARYGNGD
jgi:hypothetical protein